MSANYYVYLESNLSVMEISDHLDTLNIAWTTLPQAQSDRIAKECEYFIMSAFHPSSILKNSFAETYQIRPPNCDFEFNFRRYYHDSRTAILHIVRVVSFLLREISGDAAFGLIDMSFTYLVRRNGKTLLTTGHSFWKDDPRRLDLIPAPYQWVEKLP